MRMPQGVFKSSAFAPRLVRGMAISTSHHPSCVECLKVQPLSRQLVLTSFCLSKGSMERYIQSLPPIGDDMKKLSVAFSSAALGIERKLQRVISKGSDAVPVSIRHHPILRILPSRANSERTAMNTCFPSHPSQNAASLGISTPDPYPPNPTFRTAPDHSASLMTPSQAHFSSKASPHGADRAYRCSLRKYSALRKGRTGINLNCSYFLGRVWESYNQP
jgi:hypothetical protein